MLVGLIISSTGTTMVWPFLTIYASEKLSMPMAAVTSLMSFNSLAGLTASILAGSLVDSLMGATVQAIYYSEQRAKETEKPVEVDGSPNRLVRGWAWLSNDWVNFLSSAVGAIVGTLVYVLMTPASV